MKKLLFLLLIIFTNTLLANGLDLDELNIYQRILDEYQETYNKIGRRELRRIEEGRDSQVWGGLNKIGFNINKGFGEFNISIERYVEPALDNEEWLSRSIFEISISADKLFSKLNELGKVDLTKKQIAAFASIKFKRKFTYVARTNSFIDALNYDFSKLFLLFQYSKIQKLNDIPSGDFFRSEDFLQIQAGAFATIPIFKGVGVGAGALYGFQKLGTVTIEPIDNFVRVTSTKENSKEVLTNFSLVALFLKVVKVTLFQADFSYSYSHSYAFNYRFKRSELLNSTVINSLAKLIRQQDFSQATLEQFKVSTREVDTWKLERNIKFLLWGRSSSSEVKRSIIIKDNQEKVFFSHSFIKSNFKQTSLNKSIRNRKTFIDSKKMTITYESTHDLINSKSFLNLKKEADYFGNKVSLKFSRELKIDKMTESRYKKLVDFIKNEVSYDPSLVENIEDHVVQAPILTTVSYNIGKEGITYLLSLNAIEIEKIINIMCETRFCNNKVLRKYFNFYDKYMLMNNSYSWFKNCLKVINEGKGSLFDYCKRNVGTRPILSNEQTIEVNLFKLSQFLQIFFNYSSDKINLNNLFGANNVFSHGDFSSMANNGLPIRAFFKSGKYQGLGIINDFKNKYSQNY